MCHATLYFLKILAQVPDGGEQTVISINSINFPALLLPTPSRRR